MDLMRTPASFIKSLPTVLTSLVLLGSSSIAFAQNQEEPAKAQPTTMETAPVPQSVTESDKAAPAPAVVQPVTEPASITEVGVERLPPSAYPETLTRGLPYGSLYLTFHGMQWPYMPAAGPNSRFVLGLSGWGWIDTAYQKFAPWSNAKKPPTTTINQSNIKY